MKRKIELQTLDGLKTEVEFGESLNPIEALVDECLHMGIRHTIQSALQQAYDQGYEDAKPKWLPIDSAPRDPETRIIARNGLTVVTCYWNGANWINERSSLGDVYPATHWMPLPDLEE